MNNAIVICYDGDAVKKKDVNDIHTILTHRCNAIPESLVIKVFDDNSIAKVLLKKSAEDMKISFTEDSDAKPADAIRITFNPKDCEQRLSFVGYIKECFGCSLTAARDMFDNGKIYIPRIWSDNKIYAFVRNLNAYKVIATGDTEDFAMVQAAVFLNGTYGEKDSITLVKDFAAAIYHSHTNSADEEEQALLTAVELVKNNPASANRWVSSELINVINSL